MIYHSSYFTFQQFYERISACVLDREILVKYKKRYLSSWLWYSLDDRRSIENGYWDLFDARLPKPEFVQNEANTLFWEIQRAGITLREYITLQFESYEDISNFIHQYERYCKRNLDSEQCATLIHMAPVVDEKLKPILMYMQNRI